LGLDFLLVLALLGVAILVISAPLRRPRDDPQTAAAEEAAADIAALEAAREAKYREIREAELDLRTGKIGEDDHRAIDRELRTEAVAILKSLDRARGPTAADRPS
jgi:hypothetical protein